MGLSRVGPLRAGPREIPPAAPREIRRPDPQRLEGRVATTQLLGPVVFLRPVAHRAVPERATEALRPPVKLGREGRARA